MKIGLFISAMNWGGAEWIMSLLANDWSEKGHEVVLIPLDPRDSVFSLNSKVKWKPLDCEKPSSNPLQALLGLWHTVRQLRKVIRKEQFDCILAFTTRVNVKVLMAANGLHIPVVVSERSAPHSYKEGRFWETLRNSWYVKAKTVVVQTSEVEAFYAALGLKNLIIIPNPVEDPGLSPDWSKMAKNKNDFLFLSIARLTRVKGQDLLIKAFSQMKQVARLRILGDGEDRKKLEDQAKELGVFERIEFKGFVTDKMPHWKEADGFVLASRYEGFPNALCEALAAGIPSISFDCPTGPRAILKNEVNGLLVPPENCEALAVAMDRLVSDSALRVEISKEGVKILQDLSFESIVAQWESVFRKCGVEI